MAEPRGPGAERRVETDLTVETKYAFRNIFEVYIGSRDLKSGVPLNDRAIFQS